MKDTLKEKVESLESRWRAVCARHTRKRLESLGREVILCSSRSQSVKGLDEPPVPPLTAGADLVQPVRRKRGRPFGTRKKDCQGDAKCIERRTPKLKSECGDVEWYAVRRPPSLRLEYRCRCTSEGNKNYVPDSVCERKVGPKPTASGLGGENE